MEGRRRGRGLNKEQRLINFPPLKGWGGGLIEDLRLRLPIKARKEKMFNLATGFGKLCSKL